MTMLEKRIAATMKDMEKAQKGIDRLTNWGIKKEAKCIELGCMWTDDEFYEHRDNGTMTDKQWAAYFDWHCNNREINEYRRKLEIASRTLDKLTAKADDAAEAQRQQEHIDGMANSYEIQKTTKEEFEKWLAEFKAECAKDGITIEDANRNFIHGLSKGGKKFAMSINNGFTNRSWHSYTLYVDGETVFTSGLFATGYRYLMVR